MRYYIDCNIRGNPSTDERQREEAITMKRILALLLFTALMAPLLSGCSGSDGTALSNGDNADKKVVMTGQPFQVDDDTAFALAAESTVYALFVKPHSGEFYIKDKRNDVSYYSNPVDRQNDPTMGLNKNNLNAQLWINYVGKDNTLQISNNYVGSVNKNGAKITRIKNGFQAEYFFKELMITILIQVTIDDGGLSVWVPVSQLREEGDYRLYNIHLYPYFGAGGSGSEGYMLVPDGSGAIIQYNNKKGAVSEYRQKIYGPDNAFDQKTNHEVQQQVLLPVFGAKNEQGGFVAVIYQGEEYGYINAFVSGQKTSYNSVYADFQFRQSYSYNLDNQTDIISYDRKPLSVKDIALRYYFLPKEEADYSGMARAVQSHLIREMGAKPKKTEARSTLFLDVLGSTKSKGFFMGVPIRTNKAMTNYEQAGRILQELEEAGVGSVLLGYSQATKNTIAGKISVRISASRLLGSSVLFHRLKEFANDRCTVAFEVNLNSFSRSGNSASRYFDVIRNLSNGISRQYYYKPSTFYPDKDSGQWFLLKPSRIAEMTERLLDNERNEGAKAVFLGDFAKIVYSDFGNGRPGREVCKEQVIKALQQFAAHFSTVAVRQANFYAIPYVDAVFDAPITSSRFKIEDYDVPFYQMVMNGLVDYSTSAVNLQPNEEFTILKAIETGSQLHYRIIYDEKAELTDTLAKELISGRYEAIKPKMLARYAQMQKVFADTDYGRFSGHRLLREGVAESIYENGSRILVNYTDQPVDIDGTIVGAMDYVVMTDENP